MMDCGAVQELLPEYVTGRPMADRERVAEHLRRCETCDAARRDLEVVFALLEQTPGPSEPDYGEANTRLALRSEFAPGPLRSEWESLRREDARFRICAAASTLGTMSLAGGAVFLWKTPEWGIWVAELHKQWTGWSGWGVSQATQAGYLLPGMALAVLLMGGIAALLPALMSPGRRAVHGRRAGREV